MGYKRVYLIGASGFVGNALSQQLRNQFNCAFQSFTKHELNFLIPETYSAINEFENSLIIDCVARIEGSPTELENTNVQGLINFQKYLNEHNFQGTYLYFSTISTLFENLVNQNSYVSSKYKAELEVKKLPNYKIIRLSFVFGKGEFPNRLISRLINKLTNGDPLNIDNIKFHLTPVQCLVRNFDRIINNQNAEINFVGNDTYYLKDIVQLLKENIGGKSQIATTQNENDLTLNDAFDNLSFSEDVKETLYEMTRNTKK